MSAIIFELKEDFIPLIQLLKYTGVAESGADASDMVISGMVFSNGKPETRKRYKVRKGDVIRIGEQEIQIA